MINDSIKLLLNEKIPGWDSSRNPKTDANAFLTTILMLSKKVPYPITRKILNDPISNLTLPAAVQRLPFIGSLADKAIADLKSKSQAGGWEEKLKVSAIRCAIKDVNIGSVSKNVIQLNIKLGLIRLDLLPKTKIGRAYYYVGDLLDGLAFNKKPDGHNVDLSNFLCMTFISDSDLTDRAKLYLKPLSEGGDPHLADKQEAYTTAMNKFASDTVVKLFKLAKNNEINDDTINQAFGILQNGNLSLKLDSAGKETIKQALKALSKQKENINEGDTSKEKVPAFENKSDAKGNPFVVYNGELKGPARTIALRKPVDNALLLNPAYSQPRAEFKKYIEGQTLFTPLSDPVPMAIALLRQANLLHKFIPDYNPKQPMEHELLKMSERDIAHFKLLIPFLTDAKMVKKAANTVFANKPIAEAFSGEHEVYQDKKFQKRIEQLIKGFNTNKVNSLLVTDAGDLDLDDEYAIAMINHLCLACNKPLPTIIIHNERDASEMDARLSNTKDLLLEFAKDALTDTELEHYSKALDDAMIGHQLNESQERTNYDLQNIVKYTIKTINGEFSEPNFMSKLSERVEKFKPTELVIISPFSPIPEIFEKYPELAKQVADNISSQA